MLVNNTRSQKGYSVSCIIILFLTFLANYLIRHQVTYRAGRQPGDCIWSLQSSSGGRGCVDIYGYNFFTPEGERV